MKKIILFIKNQKFTFEKNQSGQMLVELVMAIGIAAIILPALLTGLVASRQGKPQQQQNLQATELFKETINAIKQIRDNSWATFSVNGTYHPVISGNAWTFASGATTVNGFTQQVVISDVNRNSSGAIVTSGGTLDPSTKKAVITISWTKPYASSLSSTMYYTRITNFTYTETTTTDFNKGTATSTSIASTAGSLIANDGQVQLGAGGAGGDWCNPQNYILKTFDLPGQGVAQNISATSSASRYGYAYTTTGGNASGDAVDGLTVDNNSNPPAVTNPSSNNEAKAYGIFVDNSNNYVYFNENNTPNHTVQIVRSSDLADVGYFDVSHITGSSVYVSGNTGYTTSDSTLYSFDVTTLKGSSSQNQLGSVALDGTGNRVVVVGTNAYVATSNTTKQLDIINISNPASMTKTKSINLGNSQGAVDVFVNGSQTYAYIVTSYSAGKNDFFIVDLTNTNNIYGYQTVNSMSPNALEVVTGNRAILVGTTGTLYQVFNITNPATAAYCGGMTPSGATTIKAVAPIYQGGLAYSYILTDNTNSEFQIILGGSGTQYSSSGTYESHTYDSGSTGTAYNRFVANVAQPAATSITAQVAVAPPISNSCTGVSNFTYVGPNGTSLSTDTYSVSNNQITGLIPLLSVNPYYQNPQQCLRYKFYFTSSDQTQSPELYDLIVNYSQ
jgi:hypothetical protein